SVPIDDEVIDISFDIQYGDNFQKGVDIGYAKSSGTQSGYSIIKAQKNVLEIMRTEVIGDNGNAAAAILKSALSWMYNSFLRILGYFLLPTFFVDALMARFSLTKYSAKIASSEGVTFYLDHVRMRFEAVTKQELGRSHTKKQFAININRLLSKLKVRVNRVAFFSNRRGDLSGNFEHIYDCLKDGDMDLRTLLTPVPYHRMSYSEIFKFVYLYNTSKVILIDDFYELTSIVKKKPEVKLIQVWHACGAFKTFGFSRLGKPGGPRQLTPHHRCYDYALVSAQRISRFYAEGFGIPINRVVAAGVPRTDVFFSDEYRKEKIEDFYRKYPKLKNKKIMLFAPTFRGNGRLTGYYPADRFDLKTVYEGANGQYAIIVKLHPFIKDSFIIPPEYKDYILDFSDESEINDILFVTDLLVSDYSSVIFEASLLNIPMIFYAFDLNEYIATRDFYYEYKDFLPGKLVYDMDELLRAINTSDFETEKIDEFKSTFFDDLDGKSSSRAAKLIKDIIN
ncbi:MAG: CDP-glycerol glycerophosphotransferase family protein, partial [Oscillospiraceae bacterium]|nr:CDP-glycerol glycerophosphotransferase family protein [Oscillospiraceae bacterium]